MTSEVTPPEACSSLIQRSMILTERSIRLPNTGRNLSRNPSTTSAAIAGSSSGPARRTVNGSAFILQPILPERETLASADETPAHDLDRNEGQSGGEDEDPGHVFQHTGGWSGGEGPADVDRVVERGEPGDLGHRSREVF